MSGTVSAMNLENRIPAVDLNNPDELIRANGAAEAAQADRLKSEVTDYAGMVAQLEELCQRNNELVQKLHFMNLSTTENIRGMLSENSTLISEKLKDLQDFDTRGLEERLTSSFEGAVARSDEKLTGEMEKSREKFEKLSQRSDELGHRESVRVYRNVQASMVQELSKQTEELSGAIARLEEAQLRFMEENRPDEKQKFFTRVTFGLAIGLLVLQILEGAGLILYMMNIIHF